MTDKQIIEYKHIKCTRDDCCHYCGSVFCGYVDDIENLEKAYKAKEQECERLKLDLIEAKAHSDYLNNLALSETLNLVSEQLDKYKQTLTEIKELMRKHCRKCKKHKFYHFKLCCTCKYTDILQKINECEVEDDR